MNRLASLLLIAALCMLSGCASVGESRSHAIKRHLTNAKEDVQLVWYGITGQVLVVNMNPDGTPCMRWAREKNAQRTVQQCQADWWKAHGSPQVANGRRR